MPAKKPNKKPTKKPAKVTTPHEDHRSTVEDAIVSLLRKGGHNVTIHQLTALLNSEHPQARDLTVAVVDRVAYRLARAGRISAELDGTLTRYSYKLKPGETVTTYEVTLAQSVQFCIVQIAAMREELVEALKLMRSAANAVCEMGASIVQFADATKNESAPEAPSAPDRSDDEIDLADGLPLDAHDTPEEHHEHQE